MKKIVFITLLCISVAAIAVTSGHSQSGIASAGFTNIADTTPKAHHVMVKKAAHNNTTHKTDAKTKSKSKTLKAKKPAKDSTTKK